MERGYSGSTAGDNPEGEDGGNQKQKTGFRGGPCLKRRTQKKRRDDDTHQQPVTDDQDNAKEKDVTTKGRRPRDTR
ncbi:hypothetical protein NDU88_001600 [Pleurodeles waltl]|uniref:Uncharacterized protein n=1 Tax=Pleurodeles waltl TaxID=8319 RepID=A0AAV7W0G1_PLEWA|nr:hypothetical protein NDU88_001600 [Pleurodeles waltl]